MPPLAGRFRFLNQIAKPIDEVVSVGVILENRPPLDSTNDNMLQCSGGIYSGWLGAALWINIKIQLVNQQRNNVPQLRPGRL